MPTKELQSALDHYLPRRGKLARAMRYSVFAGGKRFRPALCLAAAEALGKEGRKVLPIAAALEMIHTFTLVHDDLPGMDNSDFRRGKPTCHKKFDEATAILAGDALNTLAFDILAKETKDPAVIEEVSRALMEVVRGQVMDLESGDKKLSLRRLKAVHLSKTAALLIASVRAPAVYLKAGRRQVAALTGYAKHLGLAFQIADDILDATSTRKRLGKPVGADLRKGFPFFFGLDRSKKLAEAEKNKAIKALGIFGGRGDSLRKLADYVVLRDK